MYEFTHAGLWFRWGALDRRSKWLAGLSLACGGLAGLGLGISAGESAYDIGYRVGLALAGGTARSARHGAMLDFTPALALVTVAMLAASMLFWWRFSRRQDEMFNRVQNWALGMGGGWTAAVLTGWAILALAEVLPPVSPGGLILLFWVAVVGFWIVAVRRWA